MTIRSREIKGALGWAAVTGLAIWVGCTLFGYANAPLYSVMCVLNGQPTAVITPIKRARMESRSVVYENDGATFQYAMSDGEVCVIGPATPQ